MLQVGEVTEDARQTRHRPEILVAIGIHAGKVLVFNTLGLLVHEVVLDWHITAVEWVGDTTKPSALPNRSLQASKSRIVVDQSTARLPMFSVEEAGTVKRTTIPSSEQAPNQQLGRFQRLHDLFSTSYPYQMSDLPGSKSPHVVRGTRLRVEGGHKIPKPTFSRPRVSAKTFNMPEEFGSHRPLPLRLAQPKFPVPEIPTKLQTFREPIASRLLSLSALEILLSSSEDSKCSESEVFTPSCTRPSKCTTPKPQSKQQDKMRTASNKQSPQAANTTSIIYSSPLFSIVKHPSTAKLSDVMSASDKPAIRHEQSQRHVRITKETPSLLFDIPSSLYFSSPLPNKKSRAKDSDHGNDGRCLAPNTNTVLRQSAYTVHDSDKCHDQATKTYPYLMPDTSQYNITTSTPKSSFTAANLHTSSHSQRAKSILVRNRKDSDAESYISTKVASRSLRPRSISSVYSQSIPGLPKGADLVNDEVEDTGQLALEHPFGLNKPLSMNSPSGMGSLNMPQAVDGAVMKRKDQFLQTYAVERTTTTPAIDLVSLKEDNRVLRQEVEALRKEFRGLKDFLLKPKDCQVKREKKWVVNDRVSYP